METVEHTARIALAARQLGQVLPLNSEQIAKLMPFRAAMGLPPLPRTASPPSLEPRLQALMEIITQELLRG